MLQSIFLEDPWLLILIVGLAGLVVFLVGARRGSRTWMLSGLGLGVIAGLVYMVASLVVTPAERLTLRTRELVSLTRPLDPARLEQMFGPDAVVKTGPWQAPARMAIKQLEALLRSHPMLDQSISSLSVQEIQGDRAVVNLAVRTTVDLSGQASPHRTHWVLTWTRGSDGAWRLARAECVLLDDRTPSGWFGQ